MTHQFFKDFERPEAERIYIKSKYPDKEILKAFKARYDSEYNSWFTFEDAVFYSLIIENFDTYTKEEWKEYKANYNPADHVATKRKSVLNVETGEVFVSISAACRQYNLDKRNFAKSIKNNWKIAGYTWKYVE